MGEVFNAIKLKLEEYPQLRIGQLLANVEYELPTKDMFYLSNEKLAAAIRNYKM